MEKKNNSLGLVILVILLLIVVFIIGWFLGSKFSNLQSKNNEVNNSANEIIDKSKDIIDDVDNSVDDIDENENEIDDASIEILSIDKVEVGTDQPNHQIRVNGKMDLSYDGDKYWPVTMSGYCMDDKGVRYNMIAPGSGATSLYYDNNKNFNMVNSINSSKGDIVLADGTSKGIGDVDVDWDNLKIKSCVIEYASFFTKASNSRESVKIMLNYKKDF